MSVSKTLVPLKEHRAVTMESTNGLATAKLVGPMIVTGIVQVLQEQSFFQKFLVYLWLNAFKFKWITKKQKNFNFAFL